MKRTDQALTSETVERRRPQMPKEPFPYRQQEVTFTNDRDAVTLAGTLTYPSAAGRFPAVVLVTGSGPQDRDESVFGHKPFLVIADLLTRQGIAVLRFDDRGIGRSTGDFSAATTADFARDARAAVAFLQAHPRVESRRTGIVGHSEGALIATMLASQMDQLAHVILLAGPGLPGDEILRSQTRAIAEAEGADQAELDAELKLMDTLVQAVKDGASSEQLDALLGQRVDKKKTTADREGAEAESTVAALRAQLPRLSSPWFRYFLTYDPRPDLRRAKCPTLALNGEKDLQVLARLNIPKIEAALRDSECGNFRCLVLKDLNHLFQKASTGSPTEYVEIEETFSPAAVQIIADWIKEH
jgi:hypothetical protein